MNSFFEYSFFIRTVDFRSGGRFPAGITSISSSLRSCGVSVDAIPAESSPPLQSTTFTILRMLFSVVLSAELLEHQLSCRYKIPTCKQNLLSARKSRWSASKLPLMAFLSYSVPNHAQNIFFHVIPIPKCQCFFLPYPSTRCSNIISTQ